MANRRFFRPYRCDGDSQAKAALVKVELFLEGVVGAGYDGGVEAEDQTADGGHDGASDNEGIHPLPRC